MATFKKVFTLRLEDEVFDEIGRIATSQHRSMNNYIEYIIIKHLQERKADEQAKKNDK
ncbi:MAG: toxin-antitoxin system HicB family antitoxin [Clostridiales bacterium]|nr:toxin-antitoxin system HicB family antitoxin [Clostridiales bacterium]